MSIELMAPAGSFESLQAAIRAGADSVYFGVEQLLSSNLILLSKSTDPQPYVQNNGEF